MGKWLVSAAGCCYLSGGAALAARDLGLMLSAIRASVTGRGAKAQEAFNRKLVDRCIVRRGKRMCFGIIAGSTLQLNSGVRNPQRNVYFGLVTPGL